MFKIEQKIIGNYLQPFIIAEISGNHNGSLERAKESIKIAAKSGADAVKLQTYTPDTMTINSSKPDFQIERGPWKGYKLYDLYNAAHTPFEWHEELFVFAKSLGITIFSTPFDESAVDLLEKLSTPAYKIASFEITDLPLLKYVAQTGKPVLISTGMATEDEISESVEVLLSSGCSQLLLFHCISSYPAPIDGSNLRKIKTLRDRFGIPIGLSDHTLGNTAAIAAVAIGAAAIEKHFTLSRGDKGPDSEFSIEPDELKSLTREAKNTWLAMGDGTYSRAKAEEDSKIFRRSLYFVRNLNAGDIICREDIRRIRPGFGIAPKYFEDVIGKKVIVDVEIGDPVNFMQLQT